MIKFCYDFKNEYGFLPNLTKDLTVKPKTQEWYDLAIKPPFSQEFRLIKYLMLDVVPHKQMLVSELGDNIGHYPVNLNFFDPNIDYFSLMEPSSLERLKQGKLIFVFYYSEGDWLDLEIAPWIEELCHRHEVKIENIRFVTANAQAETYHPSYIYFPDDELYYRYLHIHQKDYVQKVNLARRSKKFTCLNRVDKEFRRLFAASLYQHGFTDQGYFSYNNEQYQTSSQEDARRSPLKWTEYWNDVVTLLAQFEIHTPFKCDDLSSDEQNNHKLINKKHYQDAYWNFVLETHFDTHTTFLTEKTFKPILNLQPFIIIGNPGSIKLLHKLGYKTFDDYVDETYDFTTNDELRMHQCFSECYKLVHYSDASHQKVINSLKPILEHNQQVFLSSKIGRLNTLLEQLQ